MLCDQTAIDTYCREMVSKHPGTRSLPIDVLNYTLLQEFDLELRARGLSVRTATYYTMAVRRWWAWLHGQPLYRPHLEAPPEARVLDLPRAPWIAPHAPTFDEADRCLGAVRADMPWVRDALVVMRYTGLRGGQVLRLRWDDVDLDRAWLTIRPELGKTRQERSGRVVPISGHLVTWLAGRGRREGWLVCPSHRQRKLNYRELEAAWVRSKVREAVWQGHPGHAFRYAFTSGLKALGADTEAVEHLVGHQIQGARSSYLDPRWALALRAAVAKVPPIATEVQLELVGAR